MKKIPMEDRRALVRTHAREYQRAEKKGKGLILDLFVEITGYNRVYAARVLRSHGRQIRLAPEVVVKVDATMRVKRKRGREYGPEVIAALTRLWKLLDYMCGKRLAQALPAALESLERYGELDLRQDIRKKLLKMGASTIDRYLAEERRALELKSRGGTKPGSLLKSQIQVRTFAEWDEDRPGFVEIDLVGHDGGSTRGDYLQTLDVTDVQSGWTEQVAVPTKAQRWVFEGLLEVRKRLPFALLGIDSDNGGEFINKTLKGYCEEEEITFTRSRPYRKNDACYVEQKNYSVVRRAVGYGRFVGPKSVRTMNELYSLLRLRTNYFLPSMKLVEKRRNGSHVSKIYDQAKTPYERLLDSSSVPVDVKEALSREMSELNLAQLHREISSVQGRLGKLVRQVSMGDVGVHTPLHVGDVVSPVGSLEASGV